MHDGIASAKIGSALTRPATAQPWVAASDQLVGTRMPGLLVAAAPCLCRVLLHRPGPVASWSRRRSGYASPDHGLSESVLETSAGLTSDSLVIDRVRSIQAAAADTSTSTTTALPLALPRWAGP